MIALVLGGVASAAPRPVELIDLSADFGSVLAVRFDDGSVVTGRVPGGRVAAPFSEPVLALGRLDQRVSGSDPHPPPVSVLCARLASNALECVWTDWDAGMHQVYRRERLGWTQGIVGTLRSRAVPTELTRELCFDPPGSGATRCAGWNAQWSPGASPVVEVPVPELAPHPAPTTVLARSSHEVGLVGRGFAEATCAIVADGGVSCTGSSVFGARGDGSDDPERRTTRVRGVTGAVELLVARGTVCARTDTGRVACWGQDADRFGAPAAAATSVVPWCRSGGSAKCAVAYGGGSDPVDPQESRGLPVFRTPVWTAGVSDAVDAAMIRSESGATLYVLHRTGAITAISGDYGERFREVVPDFAPTTEVPLR